MSSQSAEPIRRAGDDEPLAKVIKLADVDAPSFYQRNSGSLPRLDADMTDSHRRAKLPKPDNRDPDSILDTLRSLLRR